MTIKKLMDELQAIILRSDNMVLESPMYVYDVTAEKTRKAHLREGEVEDEKTGEKASALVVVIE